MQCTSYHTDCLSVNSTFIISAAEIACSVPCYPCSWNSMQCTPLITLNQYHCSLPLLGMGFPLSHLCLFVWVANPWAVNALNPHLLHKVLVFWWYMSISWLQFKFSAGSQESLLAEYPFHLTKYCTPPSIFLTLHHFIIHLWWMLTCWLLWCLL